MRFLACTLALLPLLQQGSAVQFQIPQVQAAVNNMLTALSKYVHYKGAPNIHPTAAVSVPKPQGYMPYWLENIQHQGRAPYGPGGYTVFRNVMNYGARG